MALARLKACDITRLRCLSSERNRELSTANSDINQACADARPTMVAVLKEHEDVSLDFFVTFFDFVKHSWHDADSLKLPDLLDDMPAWTMAEACDACDGLLHGFVPTQEAFSPVCCGNESLDSSSPRLPSCRLDIVLVPSS